MKKVKCPHCGTDITQYFTEQIQKELSGVLRKKEREFQQTLKQEKAEMKKAFDLKATLKIREKDILISTLSKQLAVIQQKLENKDTSGRTLGEAQELVLEDLLRDCIKNFQHDKILEVPKFVRGADCIYQVNSNGVQIGQVLIESKRVSAGQWKKWVQKAKSDCEDTDCLFPLIITSNMPGDEKFTVRDGVYICNFDESSVRIVILLLRYLTIKMYETAMQYKRSGTVLKLQEYVCGPTFQQQIQNILNEFASLNKLMDDHKKKTEIFWKNSEAHVKSMLSQLIETHATMRTMTPEILPIDSMLQKAS